MPQHRRVTPSWFAVFVFVVVLASGCGVSMAPMQPKSESAAGAAPTKVAGAKPPGAAATHASTPAPPGAAATHAPTPAPTGTQSPEMPEPAPGAPPKPQEQATPSPKEEMAQIDQLLAQSVPGSIAYNVPKSMLLNETTQVQLLLSPSASPDELKQQVTPSGEVVAATINLTARMQAELKADDPDAFNIQSLQAEEEQLVSSSEPTEWKWAVTAKKEGVHKLHLTLYRLVEYDGKEYWRKVKEYEGTIQIDVTLGQRLARFDWYWLVGIILTGLALPALWFWLSRRKKDKSA